MLSSLRTLSPAPQETAEYLRNQVSCFVVKIFLVIEILLPWKLSCVYQNNVIAVGILGACRSLKCGYEDQPSTMLFLSHYLNKNAVRIREVELQGLNNPLIQVRECTKSTESKI